MAETCKWVSLLELRHIYTGLKLCYVGSAFVAPVNRTETSDEAAGVLLPPEQPFVLRFTVNPVPPNTSEVPLTQEGARGERLEANERLQIALETGVPK